VVIGGRFHGDRVEQPVVRDHAVPGGEHVRQIGPHAGVDRDRAPDAELGPGPGGQSGLGPHPDDDQHHVRHPDHLAALHWSVPDPVPAGDPASFDTALTQLTDRVGRLAPRLAAVS